ncbi:MAG: type II toxin-antitoxin system HicA family toxin [Candidatus Kerfeldbacteria bacterium]|nr:type II toxin-antitoxin system HicA family toxin [Candidatus Kerfeldbacteria bacterium]
MPALPILSGARVVRVLGRLGYQVVRQRSSHLRLACEGRKSVTVPDYQVISRGLLRKILRDAEVTALELRKLL